MGHGQGKESGVNKQVNKGKRHIGIILILTTICLAVITSLLGKDMNLTNLDITYLYMLIFLCIKSIIQE